METVAHFGWKQLNDGITPKKTDRRGDWIGLPYTVYIGGLPSRSAVIHIMNLVMSGESEAKVFLSVGLAKLHPDDEYIKRIGAEIAEKNQTIEDFEISYFFVQKSGEIILTLRNKKYWIEIKYIKSGGAKVNYFKEM